MDISEDEEIMEIIGLSGYARSGKDVAAEILVEEFGFVRVAFADKLREVLYQLNPIVQADFGFEFKSNWKGPAFVMLQEVIDTFGWNGYKSSPFGTEVRRLLQRLGTEAGRQTLWDSIWIDAALTGLPEDAKVVVTDCRFANEAEAVQARGGEIWRISRDGVGPANSHASETGLDSWPFDWHIKNDGTLEEYRQNIIEQYKLSRR